MRRILLTQSQVSIVVSAGIVFIFTVLLFLSGLVLQQRTVSGLKQTLKPRLPKPPPSFVAEQQPLPSTELQSSRLFAGRNTEGHVAYVNLKKAEEASANVDWTRLAHIQLVRNHHDVCSAIMVLAELHRLKSPARRLLLFPSLWAEEKQAQKGDIADPFMESTRRLMRLAARRYGVELRPIRPLIKGTAPEEEGANDVYSLTSAFALRDFDRVLTIETPGLLMDASPLDAVLAFTESAPFAMLHDTTKGDGVHAEDLFLLEPSGQTHIELAKHFVAQPGFNDTFLSTAFSDPLLLHSSSEDSTLIRSIGTLHNADEEFNATAYVSDVSYIRFSDPKLPGPEYDIPFSDRVAARPQNKDADWVWTKLYGEFTQKRMEVCGLDLDHWRP